MNELAEELASEMLQITRKKFAGDFHNVKDVKIFWYNIVLLYFAKAVCIRLSSSTIKCTLLDLAKMKLIPDDICSFEEENKMFMSGYEFYNDSYWFDTNTNLSTLRECLLGIDLCVQKGEIKIKRSKAVRDTTGSYYTPYDLAKAVVSKALRNPKQGKIQNCKYSIRIADFSCGGGELFKAVQELLQEENNIPFSVSATFFWGVDVDPIILLLTVCHFLSQAEYEDWSTIAQHFLLGNPLVSTLSEGSIRTKHNMFALGRYYATSMGCNFGKKEFPYQFDLVLGNPPWEKIRFEERKFFCSYVPEISKLSQKNERAAAINELQNSWSELFSWYEDVRNDYMRMCSCSFKHPLIFNSVSGELNTYALFTELSYQLLREGGVCALIVKSTLVTTPAQKRLWGYLLSTKSIYSVSLFENCQKIFQIDSRERFAVLVISKDVFDLFRFSAGLQRADELNNCNEIVLRETDVLKMNPFSGMLPNISSTRDIQVLMDIHTRLPLFEDVFPKCHFGRLIHLTAHASQIDRNSCSDNLPIYEGKFIERYDARFSTFDGMDDEKKYAAKATARKNDMTMQSGLKPIPVSRFFVKKELWKKYAAQYSNPFSLCWRSLTSTTNSRTMLAMILPTCPMCQSIQMLQTDDDFDLIILLALFNSLPFDYFVRLKMPGIDLTQSVVRQMPVPDRKSYEKSAVYNGIDAPLNVHIFSCVYAILKHEPMVMPLLNKIAHMVYPISTSVSSNQLAQVLDQIFAEAYGIDRVTFDNIIQTFKKY